MLHGWYPLLLVLHIPFGSSCLTIAKERDSIISKTIWLVLRRKWNMIFEVSLALENGCLPNIMQASISSSWSTGSHIYILKVHLNWVNGCFNALFIIENDYTARNNFRRLWLTTRIELVVEFKGKAFALSNANIVSSFHHALFINIGGISISIFDQILPSK